jgi:hypothetical protein
MTESLKRLATSAPLMTRFKGQASRHSTRRQSLLTKQHVLREIVAEMQLEYTEETGCFLIRPSNPVAVLYVDEFDDTFVMVTYLDKIIETNDASGFRKAVAHHLGVFFC